MKNKTIIIAEAGVNHNGDIKLAKKLIDVAVNAGADYVKFQTFKTELAISKNAKKAEYQKQTTNASESQFDMVKRLELDKNAHIQLITYCKEKGIKFLSTPFDLESVDLLFNLGIELYKIPSGEITNLPYLQKVASKKLPVIMSTGMANMKEIEEALNILLNNGLTLEKLTILHANTEYPTPIKDVNLNAMLTIGKYFNVRYGYSDHTNGIEIPIAAVALGASVIEKHFTLDKTMKGPDHKASLEPDELEAMIKAIRNIELAMGNGIKKPSPSEIKNIPIARKSIVAKCDIKKGEIFTKENITVKRPGTGISPMQWNKILGNKAIKDFNKDDLIIL
ncbi:MAG TPA: N-acetylneuraminate synthase [Bacteroidales bacterium]|nr:N-acetylneuraminate synthase [Bacteroidales bacterium]